MAPPLDYRLVEATQLMQYFGVHHNHHQVPGTVSLLVYFKYGHHHRLRFEGYQVPCMHM